MVVSGGLVRVLPTLKEENAMDCQNTLCIEHFPSLTNNCHIFPNKEDEDKVKECPCRVAAEDLLKRMQRLL